MKKKLALSNFETSKLLIQNFQKFRELNITELNDTSQITVRFDERRNFLKNFLKKLISTYKKHCFLYITFENFDIHTCHVCFIFLQVVISL